MCTIIEKELKILDVDRKKLVKKLKKIGAKKVFKGQIHDVYYDMNNDYLAAEKKRVRLRKKWANQLITMKKNLQNPEIKSCHETEFHVSCHKMIHDMFAQQGLYPQREKKKKRISYTYKGITFDIDMYKGLPTLLEIEADKKEKIYKWIKKLGLQKKTTANFGSRGLFKFYNIPVTYC